MAYVLLADRLALAERRRTRIPRLCAWLWSCTIYGSGLGVILAAHWYLWTYFIGRW